MRLARRIGSHVVVLSLLLAFAAIGANADIVGSVFITGHDPDFHALGDLGARHINQKALNFVMDPGFNTFVAGGINKFLFVESTATPPGGHLDGSAGLAASGYAEGTAFDEVDAAGLNAALDNLGTSYSALVIGSDFGGMLTQAELDILNLRSNDIINFLNQGGGLYAMAESNPPNGLATGPFFGFLPFVVVDLTFNQVESGNTLTPFGLSLGLTNSDINGNFSHNVFANTGGLDVVDTDSTGHILSLAGRGNVTPLGVSAVPEPTSILLLATVMLGVMLVGRRALGSQSRS